MTGKIYGLLVGSICAVQILTAGPSSQMTIQPSSYIVLKGTSTLHDYECKTTGIHGTIEMDPDLDSFRRAEISIPVKSIHSESSSMDDNMYESLKADDNPEIKFSLVATDSAAISNYSDPDSTIKLYGNLSIAGSEKKIDLQVSFKKKEDRTVEVRGMKKLLMTDFGVDPPTFMLGVLRTGNEVTIEFDLQLKDIELSSQTNQKK